MKKALLLLFLVITGCQSQGKLEFLELVRDHKVLTAETNASLISSIKEDLASRTSMTDADRKSVENLINRLQFITRQSEVIDEYVTAKEVSADIISNLIRNKWNSN